MEVIVKASTIADIAFDLGLQSPKIVTSEEWGGTRMHTLTFGPLAYRQTIQIPGKLQEAEIRGILEREAAVQKMPVPVPPAVNIDTHNYEAKQWTPKEAETLKAPKRKAKKEPA